MSSIVHLIDCMEFMKSVPDKRYDLAIVDPPYGIKADLMASPGRRRDLSTAQRIGKARAEFSGTCKSWDTETPKPEYFNELFRISKNQIIWGGNYFKLPPTRGIICWDKNQLFQDFSAWEYAWTSFNKPAKIFRFAQNGYISAGHEEKIHPTQKPVQLYQWLLETFGGVLHGIRFACRIWVKPHSVLGTGLRLRRLRDRPVLFQPGGEAVRREDQAAEAV